MEHTHTIKRSRVLVCFWQTIRLWFSTRFEFIQAVNCVCNIPVKVSIRFVGVFLQTLKWESGPCTTSVSAQRHSLTRTSWQHYGARCQLRQGWSNLSIINPLKSLDLRGRNCFKRELLAAVAAAALSDVGEAKWQSELAKWITIKTASLLYILQLLAWKQI